MNKIEIDLVSWENRIFQFYAAGLIGVPEFASMISRLKLAQQLIRIETKLPDWLFVYQSLAESIANFAGELAQERRRQTKFDRFVQNAAVRYLQQPRGPIWRRAWEWFAGRKITGPDPDFGLQFDPEGLKRVYKDYSKAKAKTE